MGLVIGDSVIPAIRARSSRHRYRARHSVLFAPRGSASGEPLCFKVGCGQVNADEIVRESGVSMFEMKRIYNLSSKYLQSKTLPP